MTVLHSFAGGSSDGSWPGHGPLVLSGSILYGMTAAGGPVEAGTVYQVGTDGSGYSLLHSFQFSQGGGPAGGMPLGSLVQSGSTLYGFTSNPSTVFSIQTDGTGYALNYGFYPVGGPSPGSPQGTPTLVGSTLYGTGYDGGTAFAGTVFKLNTDGSGVNVLHSFAGGPADGAAPGYGALTLSGATLFGTTAGGGSGLAGTIFRVNTDGTGFGLLHSFAGGPADGTAVAGGLTLSGSTLYGMTGGGGPANAGTIFKINTDGSGYALLHTFAGGSIDGAHSQGSLTLSGSTLYGMTGEGGSSALGTIFAIETDGTGYRLLHSFNGGPGDGGHPVGDLVVSGSTLYGATTDGGAFNQGVVFSIPVPEPSGLLLAAGGAVALVAQWRRSQPTAAAAEPPRGCTDSKSSSKVEKGTFNISTNVECFRDRVADAVPLAVQRYHQSGHAEQKPDAPEADGKHVQTRDT